MVTGRKAKGPRDGERVDAVLEVEDVFDIRGRVYVGARLLDTTRRFELQDSSKLDGRAIEKWLEIPRAVDAGGRQPVDLFVFCLRDAADRRHYRVGEQVTLTSSEKASG